MYIHSQRTEHYHFHVQLIYACGFMQSLFVFFLVYYNYILHLPVNIVLKLNNFCVHNFEFLIPSLALLLLHKKA